MAELALDLPAFKTLIRERCGLNFSAADDEKLSTAISTRLAHSGPLTSFGLAGRYLARLRSDESELQELVNLLTINETYFFREPEQIHLLIRQLVPELLAQRAPGQPLRILSAGCSSGEEPYSLAIALTEHYGIAFLQQVEIVGIDIDSAILERARAGIYSDFSFRGLSADFRQRHFDTLPGDKPAYRLKPHLRQCVRFEQANLLAGEQAPSLRNFDVVFLRNVSIYFDDEGRRSMQNNIHQLLGPQGLLIVGSAETLANDYGIFHLTENNGQYYFAKTLAAKPQNLTSPPVPALPLAPSPSKPVTSAPKSTAAPLRVQPPAPAQPANGAAQLPWRHIRWLLEKQHDALASQAIAALDPAQQETMPIRLFRVFLALERNQFAAAQALLDTLLAEAPWSADVWFLSGLAAKWQADPKQAALCFQRAIYIRPDCWPAHFHLAELGDDYCHLDVRLRGYRAAQKLSALPGLSNGLDYLPTTLPAGDLAFLCQHRLNQLAPTRVEH
ncbi:MAG: hypothetical protein LWW81_03825 [Rhodocyclales bacterium]|nr:hypothetical protein [Rhodocyclales bacterium]